MNIVLNDVSLVKLSVNAEQLRDFSGAPSFNIEEHLRLETQGFRVAANQPSIEVLCTADYQHLITSDNGKTFKAGVDMTYSAVFSADSQQPSDLYELGSNHEKLQVLLNLTEQAVRFKLDLILHQFGLQTRYPLSSAYSIDS